MSDLVSLTDSLSRLEEWAKEERIKLKVREQERVRLELERGEKEQVSKVLLQVGELFKSLGGQTQEDLLRSLGKFISYGLSAVFSEEYVFVPVMGVEGKEIRVDFFIETGDLKCGITNAKGGGVAEVVSILLQVFFLVALKERFAPFLLLDTAMVHISEHYHASVSSLLKELSDKLGIQVVLIANINAYGAYADKVYHFTQEGGKTIVEQEK